jgi:pimeloyl-ACP methyl ester carboxylesterase
VLLHLGWVTHVEVGWEHPSLAGFLRRLAEFARVIIFDKRGAGMSDRNIGAYTLDERFEDMGRVMRAAGARRPVLVGVSDCAGISAAYAAHWPDQVSGLVMCGGAPRLIKSADYPYGHTEDFMAGVQELIFATWGEPVFVELEVPSMAQDPAFRGWFARYLRMAASPGNAAAMLAFNATVDILDLLPQIRVPTLILHAKGDQIAPIEGARLMSQRIPGARMVEVPGADHVPWGADREESLAAIEAFVASLAETGS